MNPNGQAARSPIGEWFGWLFLAVVAITLWAAPTAASKLWSDTGWSTGSSLEATVAGYVNLFEPEQITACDDIAASGPGCAGMTGSAFAVTTIGFIVVTITALIAVAVWWGRRRRANLLGFAAGADLAPFSAAEMVDKSEVILGRHDRDPARSAMMAGRDMFSNREIWLSKEATVLVLAPPRSGKTSGTVAPAIVDHHGPVVATGVRHDIMSWTHPYRRDAAPMWLCEPMLSSTAALPEGVRRVRWNPVVGCERQVTALLRAEALFAAIPEGGSNDQFWRQAGHHLLAGYLMAAATIAGTMADVLGWLDRDSDKSPADALRSAAADTDDDRIAAALHAMAAQLEAAIDKDPRYKAGVTGQAMQAVAPFRLPEIQQMCNVPAAESFDPASFLAASGTIWILGSEEHQRQAAGVCTALTAAIVSDARQLARQQPNGRLQPPLLLALDEAVNVAPIPRLDQLLATGGGSGIQTIIVLQSLAAARNVWGKEMGDALLDFNNAKIVLGGLSDAQDLNDLSSLLGQREERVTQASRDGRTGILEANNYSYSWRQVPVMRADEIRRLDSNGNGEALLIARASRPILLKQDRIFNRTPPRQQVSS